MGKAGFLTPKAIANRIKSKGLQKLRWFCQMCQKQCRDENGFKCHLTSESHQRQLLLFADNPDKYIDGFSQEFLDTFLELLSRRFGTKRVQANIVYQEYISDRLHTHMNSTQWETLTEFVKWLGREGHCVVDETEKGWYMQYIDRNPEVIRKQEALAKKEKMTLDDQEKTAKFIQQQVERAAATSREATKPEFTDLKRDKEEEKVAFSLTATKKSTEQPSTSKKASTLNPLQKIEEEPSESSLAGAAKDVKSSTTGQRSSVAGHKRKSALSDIIKMEEEKKEKQKRKDYWLHEGIVVKIITKKLGEKYYKKKGVIKEVLDRFACVIKMLDSGDRLKLDQAHLETVIPALGKEVLVVNGAYRGCPATLLEMDTDHFCSSIKLSSGPTKGRIVHGVQYEDISKLHVT